MINKNKKYRILYNIMEYNAYKVYFVLINESIPPILSRCLQWEIDYIPFLKRHPKSEIDSIFRFIPIYCFHFYTLFLTNLLEL